MGSSEQVENEHRDGGIAELLGRIEKAVPPERVAAVQGFARAYTHRMSAEELDSLTVGALLGQVLGAFGFADGRGAADAAVRAFNPSLGSDGYETSGTVVETNTEDQPFLVDSVSEAIGGLGLTVRNVTHPVIGTRRGADGRIDEVSHARAARARESIMHFEVDRRLEDDELRALEAEIRAALGDVRLAVRDFGPMRERVARMSELARAATSLYSYDEISETTAFLEWLLDNNFVLLGYREYGFVEGPEGRSLVAVPDSGLGVMAKPGWSAFETPVPLSSIDPELRERLEGGDLLVYTKTNRPSTVHRRARMDSVAVRCVSSSGDVVGEARLLGLFTSKAYLEPASRTPLLHRKLAQLLEREDLFEGSHDYRSVVAIFDSFPKEELFAASVDELRTSIMGLLAMQEHEHVRLFVRRDPVDRSVSVLVALRRDRFNAELRHRLQGLFMERFQGSGVEYHLALGGSEVAQIHFTVHVDRPLPDVSYEELEEEVVELTHTWDDRLRARLVELHGTDRGRRLFERWSPCFPEHYKSTVSIDLAAFDVARLEELEVGDEAFVVGLVNEASASETLSRVRLYKVGGRVQLSDVMPILEALGLHVVEEVPTHLIGRAEERFLHDFGVLGADGRPLAVAASGDRIGACIAAVWRGETESDSLNRLVVTAGLDWQQVQVLRAYRKYHHRVNASFTAEYKNDAFAAHPHVAAKLALLFELRFDPARRPREAEVAALREEILADLDGISSLDQDRILRNHLGLIDATMRTNAYVPGRGALAIKLRSADVPEMPKPAPLFEIFVYSSEVEAIHLRGGKVARGGIRWSDRRQDFRTEVLGLMKAQMVKNAVIVPTGSKGGFVLKRPMEDPQSLKEELTRQYVAFMRGLLDITDNLDNGRVVHPAHVVIRDEDDPYLVVAADKGTAALSDTANHVSQAYGFWLGDAFASGGSAGYDHKKLGITARGAWESVKRHFREMATDVMTDPFTVVGIGDMSGDVFGNGMLLSDQICLVAAFDHRHIFVDPSPAPAAGFAERGRLFHLPGSTWESYDPAWISPGGGVWPRSAKSIPVSPEMRLALGIEDAEALTPDELIRAILRAPVDLVWNGGIGTYVKASTETDAEVGDRVNDGVRVNASELRCRVVGEGGNLGFTQRGRIEYALAGGRINTDFIDNSGGVDSSDHEVNLKILLGLAMARGELTAKERNLLLAEVEDDVVGHVLYDNFLQAQILSQELELSASRMEAYEDLMQGLEAEGELDRELESLPPSEEMSERRRAGDGMARPELAVLLAYAKRSLKEALLASALPDVPYLERDLAGYFPQRVADRFGHLVAQHPLRRELIATIVANDVVNSQGVTFVSRLVGETGARPADVVAAYRSARDVTGAVRRWESLEALVGLIESEVLDELMWSVDRLVEATSRWYLARPIGAIGEAVAAHRAAFERFALALPDVLPTPRRREFDRTVQRLVDRGVPQDVAERHACQPALVHGPNIVEVAEASGRPVDEVARAFFRIGEASHLDELESRIARLSAPSRWHRWAQQALEDDVLLARRRLVERAFGEGASAPTEDAVTRFVAARRDGFARLSRFLRALSAEDGGDLAAATVAVRQVRALAG